MFGSAIVIALLLLVVLLFRGHGYAAWVVSAAVVIAAGWAAPVGEPQSWLIAGGAWAALALLLRRGALRRRLLTAALLPLFRKAMPQISETERAALEAGSVWWEGELFSGKPDWRKLLDFQVQALSEAERAFLEGPVEELCALLDDWEVIQQRDLPEPVWEFIRQHRFMGMIIPETYGGLGFSAAAHSAVVTKVASRSIAAAVTIMVPNSLGPGELLLHYGTDEQKRHYLPRLAAGEEVPCFALTGPEAGSDAAATESVGVVCHGAYEGREVLGLRLNWNKRYITLGPRATVLGLAFQLRDPDRLLDGEQHLGITCALVPTTLPGVEIGHRHDPMGIPFLNGPNQGRDVFVPLEFIIGGRDGAGQGWSMLMQSLAAGRSISLPSLSVGAAQLSTRITGAYATVREQFGLPIGRFEGIEEPLARIGGLTYVMDAARRLTAGAVDSGEHPAVASAIVKAYLTDAMRTVVNDAMDIQAGAAICRGPRNLMARAYAAVPVGITVEGANILTRSLIIFGQGVIRCHPHVLEELHALQAGDLPRFDRALFAHVNLVARNTVRALVMGLLGGRLGGTAHAPREVRRHVAQMSRLSAAFACLADTSLGILGGALKRKEKLSGRLADALAWLYLGSAAVKRYTDEGAPARDLPYVRWCCLHALHEVEMALLRVLDNYPNRPVAFLLRLVLFPWGQRLRPPSDRLGGTVAAGLLDGGEPRLHLSRDIYIPPPEEPGLGRLEAALAAILAARPAAEKLRQAVRDGRVEAEPRAGLLDRAGATGVLDPDEVQHLRDAEALRNEVIQVDAFDAEAYRHLHG